LITRVNIPFDINSVNPVMSTGFDMGIMTHGLIGGIFEYKAGVYNGEGIDVNKPTSTLSDDTGAPGLLYAARILFMPLGYMPLQEGGPMNSKSLKLLFGASSSYNIEANAESSNDFRTSLDLSVSIGPLFFSAEGYLLRVKFVERQRTTPSYLFRGGYAQLGYLFGLGLEPAIRYEWFDRNSQDVKGTLTVFAMGLNYYMYGNNLKMQAMYQYLDRRGHQDIASANDDDNSMPEHFMIVKLQFVL
jgi:hypothetical protein